LYSSAWRNGNKLAARRAPDAVLDLLQCEDPDCAALRDIRVFVRLHQVDTCLHTRRVDAPAGLHGDVLLSVELERHRYAVHPRAGAKPPKNLPPRGIKSAEIAVIGPAGKNDVTGGRQHRAPELRFLEVVGPGLLSGIEVPGLQLA